MRTSQPGKTDRSRTLRAPATPAENALWAKIRNGQLGGWKFVRQDPIGPYVADFAWRDAMIVVEIDGETHSTATEIRHDFKRDAFVPTEGYRVIRLTHRDVYDSLGG